MKNKIIPIANLSPFNYHYLFKYLTRPIHLSYVIRLDMTLQCGMIIFHFSPNYFNIVHFDKCDHGSNFIANDKKQPTLLKISGKTDWIWLTALLQQHRKMLNTLHFM